MLAGEHALLVGVPRDYAGRGRSGEFGVGHVVRSPVEGQGGLREGVQALRGGVGAAQAAEERVFHSMQDSASGQETSDRPHSTTGCHFPLQVRRLSSHPSNSPRAFPAELSPAPAPQRPSSFAYKHSDLEEASLRATQMSGVGEIEAKRRWSHRTAFGGKWL
ncbi:hypothetical protein H920_13495 [Fukomys damarensis]|uniref:Uncharacterized protein n=1 Tax=Fukomys damarensis TaxID=885580 RepID=A0A091D284_FUKDA|nr:hypothetical protein H920_13495 [Fukomys damarensis]